MKTETQQQKKPIEKKQQKPMVVKNYSVVYELNPKEKEEAKISQAKKIIRVVYFGKLPDARTFGLNRRKSDTFIALRNSKKVLLPLM